MKRKNSVENCTKYPQISDRRSKIGVEGEVKNRIPRSRSSQAGWRHEEDREQQEVGVESGVESRLHGQRHLQTSRRSEENRESEARVECQEQNRIPRQRCSQARGRDEKSEFGMD